MCHCSLSGTNAIFCIGAVFPPSFQLTCKSACSPSCSSTSATLGMFALQMFRFGFVLLTLVGDGWRVRLSRDDEVFEARSKDFGKEAAFLI